MKNEYDTNLTRQRYQRISKFYDIMEILSEKRYIPWRQMLWSQVKGDKVLEVGVGTGKNIPYYPKNIQITGIDLTPGMLQKAKKKISNLDQDIELKLGDVQTLDFPDNSFDNVVATFVFCSVPDPVLGLNEVARVLKPGGQVFLLEHVRSGNPFLGKLMDLLNPIVVRVTGANINRQTLENVQKANLNFVSNKALGMGDIFQFILARSNK